MATVVDKHQWSEALFSMKIDMPTLEFEAGQYVKIALDIDGVRIGRPCFLVNAPGEAPLEIYFNEVPEGPLTPRPSDVRPGQNSTEQYH